VRLINLDEGDSVADVTRIVADGREKTENGVALQPSGSPDEPAEAGEADSEEPGGDGPADDGRT
jgi:hypothetical protein